MRKSGTVRIGLFGPYRSDNLGDTATQMAVMANLKLRDARIEFIGICSDPPDVARTHRIPAFHMTGREWRVYQPPDSTTANNEADAPRKLAPWLRLVPGAIYEFVQHVRQSWNILRFVGRIDALVISGGGQLDDFWGGPWTRPFELFAWSAACRLRGKKVIVFATAVDNLTTRIGRALCFTAMRMAHYKAYRDQYSVVAARAAGLAEPGHACPDSAFSLPLNSARALTQQTSIPVALVCPISERAWLHSADSGYERYLDEFVEACARLIADGVIVRLSNSQVKMDSPIAQAVADKLRQRFSNDPISCERVQIKLARTVADFVALAQQADVVVASRLHGVILPLVAGTPVVGIAYMRKVSQVMADAELSEYCMDLRETSADRVTALVREVLGSQNKLRVHIGALDTRFRAALDREYDAIMQTLAIAPAP